MTESEEQQKREREARKREDELRRIPIAKIDLTEWPPNVRQIAMTETGGLGIDQTGRLYWNGKPVEITGQRLDLTWPQFAVAVAVAIFTFVLATATTVQAWTSYHDWACKVGWPAYVACPTRAPSPDSGAG